MGMRRGRKRARCGAPDQRCQLSRKRTDKRIPLVLALAGVVMALASTTTGTATRVTGGASRPDPAAVTLAAVAAPQAAAARPARQDRPPRTPRHIARVMLIHRFGWRAWQFKYLNRVWATESGWNRYASNPFSGDVPGGARWPVLARGP